VVALEVREHLLGLLRKAVLTGRGPVEADVLAVRDPVEEDDEADRGDRGNGDVEAVLQAARCLRLGGGRGGGLVCHRFSGSVAACGLAPAAGNVRAEPRAANAS